VSGEDVIENPKHYTSHPSGIECIQVTEHMGFCIGNAMKYLWRCDLKKDAVEDLKKAKWYIEREIAKRTGNKMEDPLPAEERSCRTCYHHREFVDVAPCSDCIERYGLPRWEPKV